MNALTYHIQLHQPVLTTQAQSGEPNSAIAAPFIPGSMIRGALFSKYAKGKTVNIEKDETARQLFLDGTVCYLNAYQTVNNERSLPTPLSWFVPKEDAKRTDADILNFAVEKEIGQPFKPPSLGDFVWQTSRRIQLGSPHMIGIVHNTSSDPSRKSADDSNVYRYEAIAADQGFGGVIVSENIALLTEAKALLELSHFYLGGSHTAGYGRVSITNINLKKNWQEFTPLSSEEDVLYEEEEEDEEQFETEDDVASGSDFAIITCLSDLIWRDKNGQINANFQTSKGKKPKDAFFRMRRVGGFNRKWGLPLCQSWAVQAGSVFVFPLDCYEELKDWVEKGVGERRAEGYGRVALNWHPLAKIAQSSLPMAKSEVPSTQLSPESINIARGMANRQLQAQVDMALLDRIQELSNFSGLPKTTQLAQARMAARRAWYEKDLSLLKHHFVLKKRTTGSETEDAEPALSPTSIQQWERAKVNDQSFKNWILQQIEKVEQFTLINTLPKVAGIEADFTDIQEETLVRLIEGVLQQAIKASKIISGRSNMSKWQDKPYGSRGVKERIFVQGLLHLDTPTSLGGNDAEGSTDMPLLYDAKEKQRPLLTGASIAGALRNYLREYENGYLWAENPKAPKSWAEKLFGHLDEQEDDNSGRRKRTSVHSWLMVDDALGKLPETGAPTELRDGVSIDAKTRTAIDKEKFDVELLSAGTVFPLSFELWVDEAQSELIEKFAIALHGLEQGEIGLGGRKRRGYGRCHVTGWQVSRYKMNDAVQIIGWLNHKPDPNESYQSDILNILEVQPSQTHRGKMFQLKATFILDGSLFIRSYGHEKSSADAVHLHSWRNGKERPILSGTSLAGALRNRALKIANTLGNINAVSTLIASLFGGEIKDEDDREALQASRLLVHETVIEDSISNLVQNRIAIDRFTGGSLDTALFNEQPLWGKPETRLTIDLRLLNPTEKDIGLLLLLLKDLWTGDLPLGGESSVGRGRLQGKCATLVLREPDKETVWQIDDENGRLEFSGNGSEDELQQKYLNAFLAEVRNDG